MEAPPSSASSSRRASSRSGCCATGAFAPFETYPICAWSGELGPKLAEGDRQAPEGFYAVGLKQLNPNSNYHRAFNLGFPNAYDRALGRTGSFLMVHGDCVSIGCYAMTDQGIDEIYRIVEAALHQGQREVPVHAFPFRMTEKAMAEKAGHRWAAVLVQSQAGLRPVRADREAAPGLCLRRTIRLCFPCCGRMRVGERVVRARSESMVRAVEI